MSNFAILERYNEYSIELISENPVIRISGIKNMVRLLWDAPELKLSILAKLEQMTEDRDENVARYGKQMLTRAQSGRAYDPYVPYRRTDTQTESSTTHTGTQSNQNVRNIVANVVCCVIFIIIYLVIYGVF